MTVNSIYNTDNFRSMFNALPSPVFVIDGDVMVHDYNTAAAEFLFRHMAALSGLSYTNQQIAGLFGLTGSSVSRRAR